MCARRLLLLILTALLVACQNGREPAADEVDIRFDPEVAIDSSGEWHASLGIRNDGTATFDGDEDFDAVMDLHTQAGVGRARIELFTVGAIEPDDTAWPTSWRGEVAPGAYELIWGAPDYGYTRLTFNVVERDGNLDLANLVEEPHPSGTLPELAPLPDATDPLPETAAPQVVVQRYYDWYLDYAQNVGNPLFDGAYRNSPYLSEAYIKEVDDLLAGFDRSAYDPFLQAQDLPESVEVDSPIYDAAGATVVVEFNWSAQELPTTVTIFLEQIGGAWKIVDIVPTEVSPPAPPATLTPPEAAVREFYSWYLAAMGDRGSDNFRNPLVERFYHESPLLTDQFKQELDAIIDGFGSGNNDGGGYDPLLCAQDIPSEIMTADTTMGNRTATVQVHTNFANHTFLVELEGGNLGWRISGVRCR